MSLLKIRIYEVLKFILPTIILPVNLNRVHVMVAVKTAQLTDGVLLSWAFYSPRLYPLAQMEGDFTGEQGAL